MVLMPLTGYTTSAAERRSLPWLGVIERPNLMPHSQLLGRLAGMVHHYGAYAFYVVLGLRLAAVVWHRVVKGTKSSPGCSTCA